MPATTTREPGTPGGAPVQPTFFIDVIGDSLAVLTADGLTQAFADKPEIAIADKSHEASGLVRDDYYDWPKAARDLATGKDRIDFVVVMLGINDLQPMRDGADTLDPLSDRWRALYAQRVEAVVAPFQAAHIPVAWVGLPPMRAERFNADSRSSSTRSTRNTRKRPARNTSTSGTLSPTRTANTTPSGPTSTVRTSNCAAADGIHFTKAGARKVAHFLEAEITRVFDKSKPQNETADPAARHRAGRRRHQRADPPRNGRARGAGAPGSPARSNRPNRWPGRSCR